MSQKKPKCLTLCEKALIIQELKNGASVTSLSKKYDVAKSTICKIKNNGELILRAVTSTFTEPGQRRTLRGSKRPEMEKQLYKWFMNNRNNNVTISADMIKEKAKALHLDIENNKDFTASDGWLQRFKKRFGIRYLRITGKNLSSQPELVDPFREQLKNNNDQLGITLDQLYSKLQSEKTKVVVPNDQKKEENLQKKSKDNQTEAMTEERDILSMLIPQIELNETDVSKCDEVNFKEESINKDRDEEKTECEEKKENPKKKISPDCAINALNTSIQWAEETGINYIYIQLLKEMREGALMQKSKKKLEK